MYTERRMKMNEKNNRIYILSMEKESKALLKLGIPTMIGMMVSALYNLIDAYFIGNLGTSQIGAVSVVYPLGVIILGVGLLFGSGAASYIARLLGDKKYDEASKCATTALLTSIAVGGVIILFMLLLLVPILKVLGATATILPFAKDYAVIFILGLVLNLFNITMNNIITSEGATTVSMVAMLSGGVFNILLDPILINVFHFGIKGAAIATLIARGVTAIIYLFYLIKGTSIFQFRFKNFSPSIYLYKEILKIGIPMLLFQLLTSASLSITNFLAARYGDFAVAALGVVSRIMSLWSMALFGFLKGYVPFVGYNYGAGQMERVNTATKIVLKWSTIFCVLIAAIMIVFANPIIASFTKSDAMVVTLGVKALIINAVVFCGFGFQAVYSNMFLALGMAKEGGMISIGRQGVFFIPIICLLTAIFQLNGIILAQPIADICSIILVIILIKKSNVLCFA